MANETLREATNRASPNGLNSILQALKFGDMLAQRLPRCIRAQVPVVADAILEGAVSVDRIRLPNACKASRIRRAWGRASGVGALGQLTITALNTVVGAGEIAVAPNGDIVTLAASAYTSVDVEYEPAVGSIVQVNDLPVDPTTGICALPTPIVNLHPHILIAASSTAGAVVGTMTIAYRATANPAATMFCNLSLPGNRVYFLVADAVTRCNLTLMVDGEIPDPQLLLVADNTTHV